MFVVLQFGRYAVGWVLFVHHLIHDSWAMTYHYLSVNVVRIIEQTKFRFASKCLSICLSILFAEPVFGGKRSVGLSSAELKRLQRICLELYCQYDTSLPFRELEPETNAAYYEIVQKYVEPHNISTLQWFSKLKPNSLTHFLSTSPITLDMIRAKLDPQHAHKYEDINTFIDDVKLMITNVFLFYQVSTQFDMTVEHIKFTKVNSVQTTTTTKTRRTRKPLRTPVTWSNSSTNNWPNGCLNLCNATEPTSWRASNMSHSLANVND